MLKVVTSHRELCNTNSYTQVPMWDQHIQQSQQHSTCFSLNISSFLVAKIYSILAQNFVKSFLEITTKWHGVSLFRPNKGDPFSNCLNIPPLYIYMQDTPTWSDVGSSVSSTPSPIILTSQILVILSLNLNVLKFNSYEFVMALNNSKLPQLPL